MNKQALLSFLQFTTLASYPLSYHILPQLSNIHQTSMEMLRFNDFFGTLLPTKSSVSHKTYVK